jgi:hypothetical protein
MTDDIKHEEPKEQHSLFIEITKDSRNDQQLLVHFWSDTIQGARGVASCPLTPSDLHQDLRFGSLSKDDLDVARRAISAWLLKGNISTNLVAALNNANGYVRIIIDIANDLTDTFSNHPLELLSLPEVEDLLFFHQDIISFVYHLHNGSLNTEDYLLPISLLRVLIVRSGPADQEEVPPTSAIVQHIINDKDTVRHNSISVTLLCSDELTSDESVLVAGRPTADALFTTLSQAHNNKTPYHILIYIGHGEIGDKNEKTLLLETEDGQHQSAVISEQLVSHIRQYPIPVVMLLACFSGAGRSTDKRLSNLKSTQWVPINRSIAQQIFSLPSGVRRSVGMRGELDGTNGLKFLDGFFQSLFGKANGDVEWALHEGRRKLYTPGILPDAWAMPVVFRASEEVLQFRFEPPLAQRKLPLHTNNSQNGESPVERIIKMLNNVIEAWAPNGMAQNLLQKGQFDMQESVRRLDSVIIQYTDSNRSSDNLRIVARNRVLALQTQLHPVTQYATEIVDEEAAEMKETSSSLKQHVHVIQGSITEIETHVGIDTWSEVKDSDAKQNRWREELIQQLLTLNAAIIELLKTSNYLISLYRRKKND